ncbi:MAG: carbohydrate-binding family 9-like protein [Bacteroides sp.]|nr:carbohydrate-binding family 9-like protein [Bacteroides sp.]MCM1456844.1 carbohydrate-binding family 9-like protein [Lachnoclostridium sp.]
MPSLEIPYIPALDGENAVDSIINTLDEHGVRRSLEHVNWPEYPYRPLTTFTCAHSGRYIYIDFFVRCNYLRAENYQPQSPVSEDSCVEFFVEPRGDGHYWNFEFNCIGAINASHRTERHNPTRLTPEQLAQIRVYPSCGTRPFKELEGIFTWNILVVIPLSLIGVEYKGEPLQMRANFYKCASATSLPHYLSWAPIDTPAPDFHRPEFFAPVTLA